MKKKTNVEKLIDYDALEKGSVISEAQITTSSGVSADADPAKYAFAMLKIKAIIEAELIERGHAWTVRSHGNTLRILTDEEATEYNHRRFRQSMQGAVKSHYQMLGVDTSEFKAEALHAHTRRATNQGAMIAAAMTQDTMRILPKPHTRSTPTLALD